MKRQTNNREMSIKVPVKYQFFVDAVKSEKINKKNYYTPDSTYIILNYDKHYITYDDTTTGLYRSIIFSYPDKNVVCYSLPKSIPSSIFMSKYSAIDEKIWINEAIEGVSVNLFYDKNMKKWMIATKSSIGGRYWFYGKSTNKKNEQGKDQGQPTTFLEMFIDALRGDTKKELTDLVILNGLSKEHCYNFVLMHPSNRIIMPVEKEQLYLVGVYRINYVEVEYIPPIEYESWTMFRDVEGIILFPKRFTVQNYLDLSIQRDDFRKGYMVTNMETGERTYMKTKIYDDVGCILKIKPEIQYLFLCLYRIGKEKVNEYLLLYPKMRKEFFMMRYLLEQFMKQVHFAYMSKYVFKEGMTILEKYSSHIYKLHHEVYLPSLNNNSNSRCKIKYSTVVDYFSKMEPRELLYLLNWDARMENL
jgi:hypothetical protein